MTLKITSTVFVFLLAFQAHATELPCKADGTVSVGMNVYRNYRGQFIEWNYHWLSNYYARVLKHTSGPIIDSNGKVVSASEEFLLISESDSRGCDMDIQWVMKKDFVFIP